MGITRLPSIRKSSTKITGMMMPRARGMLRARLFEEVDEPGGGAANLCGHARGRGKRSNVAHELLALGGEGVGAVDHGYKAVVGVREALSGCGCLGVLREACLRVESGVSVLCEPGVEVYKAFDAGHAPERGKLAGVVVERAEAGGVERGLCGVNEHLDRLRLVLWEVGCHNLGDNAAFAVLRGGCGRRGWRG